MSGIQTPEQRAADLLRLRDLIDAELARIRYATQTVKKRPRSVIPECGTETAYQRHRHYGEERDEACKAAHAQHERIAAIARATTKQQRPLRSVS